MADNATVGASADTTGASRQIKLLMNEALIHFYRGELEAAEAASTAVYQQALPAGMTEEACRAERCRAQIAIEQGAYARAEQLLDEALELAQANGDQRLTAGCYYARARKEALRGQYGEVESSLGLVLMHAREAGSKLYEAHAYSLLGHCRGCLGKLDEARDYWEAAIELYTLLNSESHLLFSLLSQSAVLLELGDRAGSAAAFNQALALTDCPNYDQDIAGGYYAAAYFESLLGNTAAAAALLEQGQAAYAGTLDQQSELARLKAWGCYLAATGELDDALAYWLEALAYAQHRQNRYEVAEIRLGAARTLLLRGDLAPANAMLQDAQVAFELFSAGIMLARTFCAWAQYHFDCGAQPAAQASCDKALRRAEGLHDPGVFLKNELRGMRQQLAG
jgi:tetratricopeptide (TPR) repeat protein